MGILKVKIMFFILFFAYSRYFKCPWRVCHGLMTHPLFVVYGFISKLITCSRFAAYMQLVTPSEVAIAVRMLMAI